MVIDESYDGIDAFRCEACGFHYRDVEMAEACEEYCETQSGCSSEITEQSIERGGGPS